MSTLEWFFAIIGSLTLLGVAIALACAGICAVRDAFDKRHDRLRYYYGALAKKDLAADIARTSYWLSEDVKAMNALRAVGTYLMNHDHLDMSRVRENWHALNKETK
jgi:hypothetical protein